MKKVLVDKIEGTCILAKEILGASGNVLLQQGSSLNPAMGRRLKNWGIPFVYIEGEEENATLRNQVKVSAEGLTADIEKKFSLVATNPLMGKIFTATVQFRLQKNT